jgi:hypothetical protein
MCQCCTLSTSSERSTIQPKYVNAIGVCLNAHWLASQDPKADQETTEYKVARMELVEEIAEKFVPETVLTNVSPLPYCSKLGLILRGST